VTLEVRLVTPEREVWSGEVQQLIARGVDGEIGILGGHAPVLVRLAIGPLRLQLPDGSWVLAVVDGGFLHVSTEEGRTRADVLATGGELATEIDLEAARRDLAGWEGRTVEEDDVVAKEEIAKATARVGIAG
jgi:F-type H+-transporting ATPase subunit epsilon